MQYVDEKRRKAQALRILDLSDEIATKYDRMNHFNNTGHLPEEPAKAPERKMEVEDLAVLFQRQQTLRTYISRYKRLEKSAKTVEAAARNRGLHDRYKLELEDVESKIQKR